MRKNGFERGLPKWALNLDVGSIRLPAMGMINNDSSEGAAQLFDNAVLAKVMGMYKYYYKQRVLMTKTTAPR